MLKNIYHIGFAKRWWFCNDIYFYVTQVFFQICAKITVIFDYIKTINGIRMWTYVFLGSNDSKQYCLRKPDRRIYQCYNDWQILLHMIRGKRNCPLLDLCELIHDILYLAVIFVCSAEWLRETKQMLDKLLFIRHSRRPVHKNGGKWTAIPTPAG